jgi:dihydrofolate reductase
MHRPKVIFVVAHDRKGVMGRAGVLPWHLPEDLKHFKRLTAGKPVVMGRKTFASMGKPLKDRRNIVLTRDFSFTAEGVEVANSVDDVFELTMRDAEIAVIGGAEIFTAFAAYVDAAYVTEIDADAGGDTIYRAPDRPCSREIMGTAPADERNAYAMTFVRCDYANPAVTGGSRSESYPSL